MDSYSKLIYLHETSITTIATYVLAATGCLCLFTHYVTVLRTVEVGFPNGNHKDTAQSSPISFISHTFGNYKHPNEFQLQEFVKDPYSEKVNYVKNDNCLTNGGHLSGHLGKKFGKVLVNIIEILHAKTRLKSPFK